MLDYMLVEPDDPTDDLAEMTIEELRSEIRSCGDPEDAPDHRTSRQWAERLKNARRILQLRLDEEPE